MRVVVTGALGHIGSRLIRELPAALPGVEIVMIDNLATERYASLFDLPAHGRYQFVEADVLTADLARLFAGADAVVHLAALTNWARTDLHQQMERVNVAGTERVARACIEAGAPLLFPSTTSVYGVAGVVTEACDGPDLRPQSEYAEWKLHSERTLRSMSEHDGLRMLIFRMGTIFGPSIGMRFHTAVNRFCWQAVLGQPMTVWRTAIDQLRPYLDLSDAVRAMIFVLRHQLFDSRVYNVVTLNTTVAEVVQVISAVVPTAQIAYVDSPLMNTLSYYVEGRRFERAGFEFTGSLDRGVRDTVAMLTAAGSHLLRELAADRDEGRLR